jgi:hypothetical protein
MGVISLGGIVVQYSMRSMEIVVAMLLNGLGSLEKVGLRVAEADSDGLRFLCLELSEELRDSCRIKELQWELEDFSRPCTICPLRAWTRLCFFFLIVLLFICAYNAWVISPPCPHPLPYYPPCSLPLPPTPWYPAETILPLSLILLKREYKP